MKKYLWELDIENIPLGWQETHDNAVKNYPDGEIVAMPDINSDKYDVSRYYYNPIKYRDKIIRIFNQQKAKAIELVENEKSIKILFNEILKIDVKLFNLLDLWTSSADSSAKDFFDPNFIEEEILNSYNYFNTHKDDMDSLELKECSHLRLLDLNY